MSISSIEQLFADALERQKRASEESNAVLARRLDPSQYLMSEEEKTQNYEPSLWDYPRDVGLEVVQTGAGIFTSMVDAAAAMGSGIANANAEKMADVGLIERREKPFDFNRAMYESGWWNPKAVSDALQDLKSPRRKDFSRKLDQADGPLETAGLYLSNWDQILVEALGMAPYMAATGGAANIAAKTAAREGLANGLKGEALKAYVNKKAVNAGAGMEGTLSGLGVFQDVGQHNLENGETFASNEAVLAALAAKAGTQGLSKINPMEATFMANRALKGVKEAIPTTSSEPKSLLRSVAGFAGAPLKSVVKEGLLEEGPQNVLEGAVTRVAKGEDPSEGVGSEFVQGAILGGVTGGLLHYPTHGFGSGGTVEDAVNNSSSQQDAKQLAQEQPKQAIPLLGYDRPLGADGSGGVMVGAGSDSPNPRMRLNPEDQAQTAEAIRTDVANPVAQVQQPVETQPQMSPEEAELARMEAEEAAKRQAIIEKYGLGFNRKHGDAFAEVTGKITDEAEKDFYAKILQAAGEMGINNPFKGNEATKFASEYKNFDGDTTRIAEFYRNYGLNLEETAGKKQGALREAEFYQQLADLLEGEPLMNFKQRRDLKTKEAEKKAKQVQTAQVRQTAAKIKAAEPAPVEAKPQPKHNPIAKELSEADSVRYEETNKLSPQEARDVFEAQLARIKQKMEVPEEKEAELRQKIRSAYDAKKRKSALKALHDLETPPVKKEKKSFTVEEAEKYQKARASLQALSKNRAGVGRGLSQKLAKFDKLFKDADREGLDEFIDQEVTHVKTLTRLENAKSIIPKEKYEVLEALSKQNSKQAPDKWGVIDKALAEYNVPADIGENPDKRIATGKVGENGKEIKTEPAEEFQEPEADASEVKKIEKIRQKLADAISKDTAMNVGLTDSQLEYVLTEGSTALQGTLKEAYKAIERRANARTRKNAEFLDKAEKQAQKEEERGPTRKSMTEEIAEMGFSKKEGSSESEESSETEETSKRMASKSAKSDPETSRIRGLQRLQEALENRTSAHRAMWSPSLDGWVDFDFGKIGAIIDENFTVKGAMGVSHIVDKRTLSQNLKPREVAEVLREMVNTVANGKLAKGHDGNAILINDKFKVVLAKKGGNAFVITGFGKIKKEDAVSSGTSDTANFANANLYAYGKSIPPTEEREKNLSKVVKIIADQKLLFKGDEANARKASRTALSEKEQRQNFNNVRNGLYKTWGVSTTHKLLSSGKVVICRSNEEFVDTIVEDNLAAQPEKTEEKIRAQLEKEGLTEGVEGLYDPNTGKVYLNGEKIDENDAGAVLCHEVGVHAAKNEEFRKLITALEDQVIELMKKGLVKSRPAEHYFWRNVMRRLQSAGLVSEEDAAIARHNPDLIPEILDNLSAQGREEALAYFMSEYTKGYGVKPKDGKFVALLAKMKDWVLRLLNIKSLNEHQIADIIDQAVRAYADETAKGDSNLSGRKASKSTVKDSRGKYANPNAEEHARYAEQLRSEEPRSYREEFGKTGGQYRAANYGRANKAALQRLDEGGRSVGGGLRVLARWEAPEPLKQVYSLNGMATPPLLELDNSIKSAFDFRKAILDSKKDNPVAASVYAYEIPNYRKMKLFLTEDRKAGVAVKPNGDVVSVFNAKDSPNRGVSHMLMEVAIANGGRKLDCFDTVLPDLYAGHGFRAITRQNWNDDYAPTGWDKQMFHKFNNGEPDVVYMVYDPSYYGVYEKTDGSLETDYGEAVRKQTEALEELHPKDNSERMASKKAKKDKPKRVLTPSQQAAKELKDKQKKLKQKIKEQKDYKEGEAYREQTAASLKGYNDLQQGKSIIKVAEELKENATPQEKQMLSIREKVLAYMKKLANDFNFSFLKFTNELVADIGERCPAAKTWFNELLEWGKDRQKYRNEALEIYSRFDNLSKATKDKVEKLLFDSTTSGLWAFDISEWKDAEGKPLDTEKSTVSPGLAKRYDDLAKENPQAAEVVYDALKHGYDRFLQKKHMVDTVGKAVFGDKYRSMIKMPKSVMPYMPLVRTGQYNVVWRSNQLKAEHMMLDKLKEQRDALEAAKKEVPSTLTNAIKNTEDKIDSMERSEEHYVVSRFDSLAEATDSKLELSRRQSNNEATLTDIGDVQKKSLTGQANIDRMLSEFEEKFEERYGKGMGVAMRQSVQEMLMESAQKTMDSSTKLRRNVAGANPHVMETFMHHANTDAWMLSNLAHGKNISNAFTALGKEVKAFRDSPKTENQKEATQISSIYNELTKRYNFITKREDHSLIDDVVEGLRGFNTLSMLSLKPAYYIQNALQPTMMTMPYLSGEFHVGTTVAYMTKAYGEWKGFVGETWDSAKTGKEKWHALSNIMKAIQNSKLPADEKEMLLDMERRNLLDLGAQADFGSFRGNSSVLKMMNKGMTEIGYAARSVELMNRYVTATAAYRLMKIKLMSKGLDKEKAIAGAKDYAASVLSKTQGDYSGLNAPSAFNTKLGKVALQFRKFQAIQLNYFLDMLKGSLKGATAEERAVYRKQLSVAIGTHLVMAGMNGAPAMAIAYALAGALAGDDGEEGEDTVRRLLSEAGWSSDMIDIVMEGPLSAIGINLSNSVGAGQMLSPVPYTRKGLTEEGGMMEFLTSAFGGATASRLIRIHTGLVQSNSSNMWRPFFEAALPAGIPQLLKATYLMDPTLDKRTGAKMLSDDELSVWHSFVQALGLTPSPVERMYQMRNVAYRTQNAFKEDVSDIKRRWIDAMKKQDYKAQAEIRKELPELNRKRRAKGFPPVKMDDLWTAWKTRLKEEKLMQKNHGLKLPNSQQGLANLLNKVHTQ